MENNVLKADAHQDQSKVGSQELIVLHVEELNCIKEYLIERVKTFPALWNLSASGYKKSNVKDNCWLAILKELKKTFPLEALQRNTAHNVKGIKSLWQSLRGSYRKTKSQMIGKSGAGSSDVLMPENVKWRFFGQMRFLDSKQYDMATASTFVLSDNDDDITNPNENLSGSIQNESQERGQDQSQNERQSLLENESQNETPLENDTGPSLLVEMHQKDVADNNFLQPAVTGQLQQVKHKRTKERAFKRKNLTSGSQEESRNQRHKSILEAVDQISSQKPTFNSSFCSYLETQLNLLPFKAQLQAHRQISDLMQTLLEKNDEDKATEGDKE